MPSWPVQDAKARFSEMLELCIKAGPQVVTKRGMETAVLVPMAEWHRLQAHARRSLKQLLLEPSGRFEFDLPKRGAYRHRPVLDFFDN